VVITGLTRNQFVGNGTWVRIPPSPPHFVRKLINHKALRAVRTEKVDRFIEQNLLTFCFMDIYSHVYLSGIGGLLSFVQAVLSLLDSLIITKWKQGNSVKHHAKYATAFFLLIILLTPVLGCSSERPANQLKAIGGKIEITEDQIEKHTVKLDGEWEFYWNELLTPEDFRENEQKKTSYIYLPGSWNAYMKNDGKAYVNGYASYRLLFNTQDSVSLGLKIPRIFTAYQLWVNGEQIASAGIVGKSRSDMSPQYLPQIALFTSQQNENEIVIQVSNFNHRSGGILESIILGSEKQILDMRYKKIAYEFLLFVPLYI
jgi:hypothetical protein